MRRVCDNQAALSIKTLGLARDVAGFGRFKNPEAVPAANLGYSC